MVAWLIPMKDTSDNGFLFNCRYLWGISILSFLLLNFGNCYDKTLCIILLFWSL